MRLLSAACLAAVLASVPATAATAAKPVTDPIAAIQQFTVADLQAALDDAQASGDTTAAACYTALIPYVQANINNPLPTKLGAFLLFQKGRDLKTVINAGIPAAINNACAPLVLDAQNTILLLGAKVGLTIASPIKLPLP